MLRVEHLGGEVLGLGVTAPRLSWRLPEGSSRQEAYQVEMNGETSERVAGQASVLVPWPGAPLSSRQRVQWRVQVWTDQGLSDWSPPAWFEAGLLAESDWSARWIEPTEIERAPHVLLTEFHSTRGRVSAVSTPRHTVFTSVS